MLLEILIRRLNQSAHKEWLMQLNVPSIYFIVLSLAYSKIAFMFHSRWLAWLLIIEQMHPGCENNAIHPPKQP